MKPPTIDPACQVYNTVFVRWTTHHPRGLSAKDIDMAAACDVIARDFAEVAEAEVDANTARQMQDLTNAAASSAGDCCVPKDKGTK